MGEESILAAREKLKNRFKGQQNRGKGTARRKKKAVHKSSVSNDKKFQAQLKRLGVNQVNTVDDVVFLMEDNSALEFKAPKVHVNINGNTLGVIGAPVKIEGGAAAYTGGMGGLGGLPNLQGIDPKILQQFAQQQAAGDAAAGAGVGGDTENGSDDDELPELVENFEAVSESA